MATPSSTRISAWRNTVQEHRSPLSERSLCARGSLPLCVYREQRTVRGVDADECIYFAEVEWLAGDVGPSVLAKRFKSTQKAQHPTVPGQEFLHRHVEIPSILRYIHVNGVPNTFHPSRDPGAGWRRRNNTVISTRISLRDTFQL